MRKKTILLLPLLVLTLIGARRRAAIPPDGPTFNREVVRILQQNCQSCHHPDDIAPFSLMTYGDAVLPLPGGGTVCAVSSITGALVAQLIGAEVVRRLTEAGETPPVYLSANVPGGDEHNSALEDRYAGRIRRTA